MDAPNVVLVTGPPGTGKSTLASGLAPELNATVLGWDWAMAAMTWCEPVQATFTSLDLATYRRIGWSILWSLGEAQLREGRSIVLDGLARKEEVAASRALARRLGARPLVVATECSDVSLLRARVEGRHRAIPGWHELSWDHVTDVLTRWTVPSDVDVSIDSAYVDEASAVDIALSALRSTTGGAGPDSPPCPLG